MSKFKLELVRKVMDEQECIRNISVIAHVDHGKSTLTDALIAKAGLMSQEKAGQARWTDKDEKEIEKGITIKSTGVSMFFDLEENKHAIVNLIDSPGHVDFSSEVTAALRVSDGALVVVDAVEGAKTQTVTVLRQAMQERIKPVLIINKVDRAIMELKQEGEEIYQNFVKVIENINSITALYENEVMGDILLDPTLGNVAFGAGKDQWAFTLLTFAKIYSKKYGIPEDKMMKKLWGDNYFDNEVKKWKTEPISESGKPLKRSFVQFILDPILSIFEGAFSNNIESLLKKIGQMNVPLTEGEKELKEKELLKVIMRKWIPAADCLIEMFVNHLPSPVEAQKYKVDYLYEGDEEIVKEGIRNCDPKGPLVIYISKMVDIEDGRFAAFGRIFSGTVISGQKVKIIGANYKEGSKNDYFEKNLSGVMIMIGNKPESIGSVPCGNTVALTGIDQYLIKTGTITSIDTKFNNSIRPMKYSVSPVFRVAVKPSKPNELPDLIEGLRKLEKADPLVKWTTEETGENVIAGCGELHMEICIHELKKYAGNNIIVSEPVVAYRETILSCSGDAQVVKTSNKHNRFWGTAEPLNKNLVEAIENEEISEKDDPKERNKRLATEFDWEKDDTFKIWTFDTNFIVDLTKGVQYMNEVKDSIVTSFSEATREGVLAGECLRGVRFNITDGLIHADAAHRKTGQVMPAARRLFHGLELISQPTLLEPFFLCEITTSKDVLGGIYQCLNQRKGKIIEVEDLDGVLNVVKAYLPVSKSYGFSGLLREKTEGKAFPQCVFSHWEPIDGNPLEDVEAKEIVKSIRKRKGMKEEIPNVSDLLDKL